MSTVIFRTITPFLASLMVIFSIFVLLRGHNEPGGGFIGGLVAVSAIAIYAIAYGVQEVRRALRVHPIAMAGCGLFMGALSGVPSLIHQVPYLTGLWWLPEIADGVELPLSTPLIFDIGVYLVVVGAILAIALALEEGPEEEEAD